MKANERCPTGKEVSTESRCREANTFASSLGLAPQRTLQVGGWNGVPYQCSAQVGHDDALHFDTNSGTDNSRFTTGEFVMICEGKTNLTILCTATCGHLNFRSI